MNTIKYIFLLGAIPTLALASSGNAGWTFMPGKHANNSNMSKRYPLRVVDDIINDHKINIKKLNDSEKYQARVWGISNDDEIRYLNLMKNRSGIYFKKRDLSPVQVLGINSRSDNERKHYAAIDVRQEALKNSRILAYGATFHQAALRFASENNLPVLRPFDKSKYSPYNYKPVELKSGDIMELYITLDYPMRTTLHELIKALDSTSNTKLKIFFQGRGVNKGSIQVWAKNLNLSREMVSNHTITLVSNSSLFDSKEKTPSLSIVRLGKIIPVDLGGF
jgi:integrating conjugative element protein (TIGR03759 family)